MKSVDILDTAGQIIDIVRGSGIDHFHFREKTVFLQKPYLLLLKTSAIQIGDEIYHNDTCYCVRSVSYVDYSSFKIAQLGEPRS